MCRGAQMSLYAKCMCSLSLFPLSARRRRVPRRRRRACHTYRTCGGRFSTSLYGKSTLTNVIEHRSTIITSPRSLHGYTISTSVPGTGTSCTAGRSPQRSTENADRHEQPRWLRTRQPASRPCASGAARERGQEDMRWVCRRARRPKCARPLESLSFASVASYPLSKTQEFDRDTCDEAHTSHEQGC